MNQQRGPKLIDSLNELVTRALFLAVREQAPLGPGVVEREVDKLSGKLSFFHFDFFVSRGKPKRAACGITCILIATHLCLTSGLDYRMTNLGRISDAKLFCPVSGLNANSGEILSILKILKSCLTRRKKA